MELSGVEWSGVEEPSLLIVRFRRRIVDLHFLTRLFLNFLRRCRVRLLRPIFLVIDSGG